MQDLLHSFPGQEADEPVFIFVRPYWVSFIPTALAFLFLMFFAIGAQALIATGSLVTLDAVTAQNIIYIFGIFQLVVVLVFLVAALDFYFDIVVVTDRRLVDIDQEQLFFRRISQLNLEDVEDVTSVVNGFFPSIFNYGSLEVQTAGEARNFEIPNIKNTHEIEAIISDLADQAKNGVPTLKRVPAGNVKGVIENQLLTSADELNAAGALHPSDLSRFS